MSEFYFDYKCIATDERRVTTKDPDRALDFYLYQDYDGDGGMCVQIYVPKTLQKNYCAARLYFVPNGIDFPNIRDGAAEHTLYTIAHNDGNKYPCIKDTNSIILKSKALSGCGVLAFIDGDDIFAPPKVQNTYKFTVNYTKKETISYSIDENKTGFTLRVIYPLIRTLIDIAIVKKRNAKPVLIGDRLGADKFLTDKNGERITVTLRPTGRASTPFTVKLDAEGTYGNDFRLVFCDAENNKYYLLVDESEYTIEDKKRRKSALSFKRKITDEQRRCPYCNGRLVRNTRRGTVIQTCDGKILATKSDDPMLKGKHTVICKHDVFAYADGETECEAPSFELPLAPRPIVPNSAFDLPSMNVTVAGFPNSGKSVYLASVMNMAVKENRVVADPFILRRIVDIFGGAHKKKHGSAVEEVPFNAVKINENGKAEFCRDGEDRRASVDPAIGKTKLRYVLSVGDNTEANTPPSEARSLSYDPIGFKLGKKGYIYFYDVPGELFKFPVEKLRSVDVADCFIAVIDGDPVKESRALSDTVTALENINKLATRKIDLSVMPIAVVFTKHDKKLSDYIPPSDQAAIKSCFDENCHVVREDMLALDGNNGEYSGSDLERHINCSSYELEHYLKSHDEAEFEKLIDTYKNIKFFTCSALGSDVCLSRAVIGNKEVLFRPRRIRVELPLIWLMYAKGLIEV